MIWPVKRDRVYHPAESRLPRQTLHNVIPDLFVGSMSCGIVCYILPFTTDVNPGLLSK